MKQLLRQIKANLTLESGISLVEVLVSTAIFAVGITSVAVLQFKTVGGNARGRMITEATVLAEQRMEQIMETPYATVTSGNDSSVAPYAVSWVVSDKDLDGDGTNESKRVDLTVSSPQLQGSR
ncbi:MAG: hypothetical protein AB1659_10335, partial [Thermodesulfobacteriota bacterium]